MSRQNRPGSVLPILGVCLIALFAFVALAVDIGMLAVSRTQCQNAADAAALVGCRYLNNKPGTTNSNWDTAGGARDQATGAVTRNVHLSGTFAAAQITTLRPGVYTYDTTNQRFVASFPASPPAGQSWTAVEVGLSVEQPTYFMRVLGVATMPTGARAVAVHRPRDVAFVLDMTGSMAYATTFNYLGQSMNPDTLVPGFGHYPAARSFLVATSNQATGTGEAISRNNYCITTPGGPPVVRNFYFDPANVSNPAATAFPVTSNTSQLKNAFHRWSPPESGGDSTNYVGVTYDFTGYNAYHNGTEANPRGPTPAPDTFGTMTDSSATGVAYVGDRWRRGTGAIDKALTSWATTDNFSRPACHAADLLGYTSPPPGFAADWSDFRDPVWEANGYDLNVFQYRTDRGSGGPLNPNAYFAPLVPAADRFQGFSMGPGYWGKTFYIWPPDPRPQWDWRRRFFLNRNGQAFDPQVDNDPTTTGANNTEAINEVLLNGSGGNTIAASNNSANFRVNYPAVLAWIKGGPQVLPPNLRAGRVLYYSSIPSDVDTNSGSAQEKLDKVFWREYIDYVVGHRYISSASLYGYADSWAAAPTSITTADLLAFTFPWETAGRKPYMRYTDSPNRPRLHLWFGPLSMMAFLRANGNWMAGTTNEAQCWQLKAGMNSVLDDIRNNHPNDAVGLVDFAYPNYKGVRVPMGQDFATLKNALFYPKSLLAGISAGDVTTELRPYDLTFAGVPGDEIPNAIGSTDPNTGLAFAFNLLSPSSQLPATYGSVRGRRGASKVVIFETDGVPNAYSSVTFTPAGYDSYYTNFGNAGILGNGNATVMNAAYDVVRQLVKPMAGTNGGGVDSGLSLPNAPARVYAVGFGDLFDPVASPNASFRTTANQFLANVAYYGGTGPANASAPDPSQVITGPYQQRIGTLKTCMERIFQSGVSVTLIE